MQAPQLGEQQLNALNKEQLKDLLRKQELAVGGNKPELVARLLGGAQPQAIFGTMTVPHLRQLLGAQNLPATGTKPALLQCLGVTGVATRGGTPRARAAGVEGMNVLELRAEAKRLGRQGYSKLNKEDLLKLVRGGRAASPRAASPRGQAGAPPRAVSPPRALSPPRAQAGAQDLNAMTVVDLKALAKQRGIGGYSKLNKGELIALIQGAR
jgi:hypothetical protein